MTLDEEHVFSKLIIACFKQKKLIMSWGYMTLDEENIFSKLIISNLISIISKLETQCKCNPIYPIAILG